MPDRITVTGPDLDGVPIRRVERRPIPVMFLEIRTRSKRSRRLGNAPAVYSRIGLVAQALRRLAPIDDSLPGVEFYRRHGEIDMLLPVLANTR
jgi:hypothetical protein